MWGGRRRQRERTMRIQTIRRLFAVSAIAFGTVWGAASSASAAVPGSITHQGRLFDTKGAPVTDTLDVVITIYDGPDAGASALWTEVHSVTFENGYFSMALGETVP